MADQWTPSAAISIPRRPQVGETVTRAILGASTGGLSEVGFAAKNVLEGPNAPGAVTLRQQKQEATKEQTLVSAKNRRDRLSAARGRRSFRIQLADKDPRATRGGIAIG
jgi:hypothetical protein